MPQHLPPQSHSARYIFLKRAALTGQVDINNGRTLVSQGTVDNINNLLPSYRLALNAIVPATATRSRELRERNEAIGVLQVHVRDFWEVLKRRVVRMGQDAEVLNYYGLPLDGVVPRPETPDQWIEAANACVAGDALAVAAGLAPMSNPSVPEMLAVITVATAEQADVSEADRDHDEALAAANALVPVMDGLAEDVMAQLRFNTRKMDFPSQRRIQRTYGARFRNLPGEPNEGDFKDVIGTGDGVLTTFEGILTHQPVLPASIGSSDGIESFTDTDNGDGTGLLTGSAGGTGSIVYATGAIQVNFASAPITGAAIVVEYVAGA